MLEEKIPKAGIWGRTWHKFPRLWNTGVNAKTSVPTSQCRSFKWDNSSRVLPRLAGFFNMQGQQRYLIAKSVTRWHTKSWQTIMGGILIYQSMQKTAQKIHFHQFHPLFFSMTETGPPEYTCQEKSSGDQKVKDSKLQSPYIFCRKWRKMKTAKK